MGREGSTQAGANLQAVSFVRQDRTVQGHETIALRTLDKNPQIRGPKEPGSFPEIPGTIRAFGAVTTQLVMQRRSSRCDLTTADNLNTVALHNPSSRDGVDDCNLLKIPQSRAPTVSFPITWTANLPMC